MSIIKSRKGKDLLSVDGYIFRRNNSNITTQNWRCVTPKCNATAVSSLKYMEKLEFREGRPHNHPPNPTKRLLCDAMQALDEEARSSDAPPRVIVAKLCQTLDKETVAALPDMRALSKRIHRKRKEAHQNSSDSIKLKPENHEKTEADIPGPDSNNVKPLPCSFCEECFSHRHSLLKHERTKHWGQVKHCNVCNREFQSVSQHRKQCKGRSYRCKTCGETFHSARGLGRHKTVSHPFRQNPLSSEIRRNVDSALNHSDAPQTSMSGDGNWHSESPDTSNPDFTSQANEICSNTGAVTSSLTQNELDGSVAICREKASLVGSSICSKNSSPVKTVELSSPTKDRVRMLLSFNDKIANGELQGLEMVAAESGEIPPQLKSEMAEDVFQVFQENWSSIRTQSSLNHEVMDRYNFHLTNLSLDEVKEAIKSNLSWTDSPFKINLAFGYIVRDSGQVRYVQASPDDNAVFEKPRLISEPEELDRFLAAIALIFIAEKSRIRWLSSDAVVEAVTNVQIYVHRPLRASTPKRVVQSGSEVENLDVARDTKKPNFGDAMSVFRCIAEKLGCRPDSLDSRTGEVYWKYAKSVGEHLPNGVPLQEFHRLEDFFGLQITVFQSRENGNLKMLRRGGHGTDTLHLQLVGNCYHYISEPEE